MFLCFLAVLAAERIGSRRQIKRSRLPALSTPSPNCPTLTESCPDRSDPLARPWVLVFGALSWVVSQAAASPCRRAAVHTQPQPSLAQPPEISLSVSSAWWVYAPRIPSPPLPGNTADRELAWRVSRSISLLCSWLLQRGRGSTGLPALSMAVSAHLDNKESFNDRQDTIKQKKETGDFTSRTRLQAREFRVRIQSTYAST